MKKCADCKHSYLRDFFEVEIEYCRIIDCPTEQLFADKCPDYALREKWTEKKRKPPKQD